MSENRVIKLCNKHGVETEEVTNIEVGYEYELRHPIVIKKQMQGSNEEERITRVTIEKGINRRLQKTFDKIKDEDEKLDKMLFELTSLTALHIDELSVIDVVNLSLLMSGFLPESIFRNETEN